MVGQWSGWGSQVETLVGRTEGHWPFQGAL